jgi:hypothetical protein
MALLDIFWLAYIPFALLVLAVAAQSVAQILRHKLDFRNQSRRDSRGIASASAAATPPSGHRRVQMFIAAVASALAFAGSAHA